MARKEQSCKTCVCPTKMVLTKAVCPGFDEGSIWPVPNCQRWGRSPDKFTVSEARQYSIFMSVSKSRPTIISMCKKKKIIKLIGGRYAIDAEKFRELMEGE